MGGCSKWLRFCNFTFRGLTALASFRVSHNWETINAEVVFNGLFFRLTDSHLVFSELMEVTLRQRELFTCQIYAWSLLQISLQGTLLLLIYPWYVILVITFVLLFCPRFIAVSYKFFILCEVKRSCYAPNDLFENKYKLCNTWTGAMGLMTSLSLPFQFGRLVLLGATSFTISVTSFQTSIPIAA